MLKFIKLMFIIALMTFHPRLINAEGTPNPQRYTSLSITTSKSPLKVFEHFWNEAKSNFYPIERETQYFTIENYLRLKEMANSVKDLDDLANKVINPFLNQLQVSHTQFYTNSHPDFYLLNSLFSGDITIPKLHHIGIQVAKSPLGYLVQAVLEGYPAHAAGIQRGDIIKSVDGEPFHPIRSFQQGRSNTLSSILCISRNGSDICKRVWPVYESMHESFLRAMTNSFKIVHSSGRKIGYVHLWSGTHELILKEFLRIIGSELAHVDSLILDLRDGMGGAWHSYLDPFFPDRSGFFVATLIDRLGVRTSQPVPNVPLHPYFAKPMVVLINEGVRSGKESLAYQFKKSGRATLVGTTTAGAFCAGQAFFSDSSHDYILYLAVAELLLDDTVVEGRGIAPQIYIPYPSTRSSSSDPQFEKALQLLYSVGS